MACITSLPYLMEFPHECAEQTFNRFYANELSSYIIATHPAIKSAGKWRTDSIAQLGSLVTNPELKQVLLNETPWVFDAGNETNNANNLVPCSIQRKMTSRQWPRCKIKTNAKRRRLCVVYRYQSDQLHKHSIF